MNGWNGMEITYFDVVVGTIIIVLGIKGVLNGFSRELFGLVGVVGGLFVAFQIGGMIGQLLNNFIFKFHETKAINFLGFMFTLVIFAFIMNTLGKAFKKHVIAMSGLTPVDKILGFFVGGGKFFLIFSVIVYAFFSVTMIREHFGERMKHGFFFKPMFMTGNFIVHMQVDDIKSLMDENLSHKNFSQLQDISPKH
jgi:membrane protein required for colicin V production